MAASRNSGGSPASEVVLALAALVLLSAAAAWCFYRGGFVLYYGDAEAHLNMARRVVDSRTPGLLQLGGVWLPLPHLLMLPLVANDGLWRSGLGGTIPSAACFVTAGLLLFLAARRRYASGAAAAAALGVFALNPNLLYLQSAPMTEPVFFAAVAALLYCTVRFGETQSPVWVGAAGLAGLAASLTRYEGWFLIPVTALCFLTAARERRVLTAAAFGAIAALGPMLWLAHNWWWWDDPLWFARGPYSARGIYYAGLAKGYKPYRGDHDWANAWLYFRSAMWVAIGRPGMWVGLAGVVAALFKRVFAPLALLSAAPLFYVWSVHSGGTPIYVPRLWPFSYYNTRYGLAALPLLAFAAGALVAASPARLRRVACVAAILAAASPWLLPPTPESWVCWKESQVNSLGRRAATKEAAEFLKANYVRGAGIAAPFGDLAGALRQAGIPLAEMLHEDNAPYWQTALAKPDWLLRQEWAITKEGERASGELGRALDGAPRYRLAKEVAWEGEPLIRIYRRN